jgi:hypothetical protein
MIDLLINEACLKFDKDLEDHLTSKTIKIVEDKLF